MQNDFRKFSQLINHRLLLTTVIFVGLLLRLYQLGTDSFWIDEVGVAQVIARPSLLEMLREAHNHVMAMPLDYILDWIFARFGAGEGFLRLPAALWGVLTLVVCYICFKHLTNKTAALLTTLILALSPFHIQYSQELRFYAALAFFYWLVTWMLWRAIEKPTIQRWGLFSLSAVIGIYFHVYVLLAALNGFFWLWVGQTPNPARLKARVYFLRSMVPVLLAFIIGLFIFGSVYTYENIPLLMNDASIFGLLGIAFGWLPFYPSSNILPYILGGLSLVLAVIGLAHQALREPHSPITALIYSMVVQITVIVLMNYLKTYFLAPRQFIAYLPMILYLSAHGAITLGERAGSWWEQRKQLHDNFSPATRQLILSLTVVLILASIPALLNYYQGDKGKAREISQRLEEVWTPGDIILTIPDYEARTYKYYFEKEFGETPSLSAIYSASWTDISEIQALPGNKFLITPYPLDASQISVLANHNFQPFYTPKLISRYSQAVWVSNKSSGQSQEP
jgi:Dolichyl-phosphate-mannose-protein mannosyltransferase